MKDHGSNGVPAIFFSYAIDVGADTETLKSENIVHRCLDCVEDNIGDGDQLDTWSDW